MRLPSQVRQSFVLFRLFDFVFDFVSSRHRLRGFTSSFGITAGLVQVVDEFFYEPIKFLTKLYNIERH